jgi:hypothetical protein
MGLCVLLVDFYGHVLIYRTVTSRELDAFIVMSAEEKEKTMTKST